MPKTLVDTGSYIISAKSDKVLDAILGTCVGVTLCDRHANVGGLIHLLLPEPTGWADTWQPAKFATTGLPLFIQELCDLGASRERLEACIAGGALLDPLSELDLILDIGGRTFESANKILHTEGISIIRAETGGFFTCNLSLNLQTWETNIEPSGISKTYPGCEEFKKPDSNELDRTIERVRPIPQIALKIIRMINDSGQGLREIADEVCKDQVLSARVLRMCNSALFGLRKRVDSIDRAMIMLGEKALLRLAVSAALEGFFSDSGRGYSLCKGGLYYHALATAKTTEVLANLTGKVPPGIAYTAGLLHDIGKVVLDQYMAPAFPYFYRRTHMDGIELVQVEREVFGIDHAEAGTRLAERWSLPRNLIDAISHHHIPERGSADPVLTPLVYLADLIVSRFLVGQELERHNTHALPFCLRKAGIKPEQLPGVIDRIPLDFHTPSQP